jgi:hypothetical protein
MGGMGCSKSESSPESRDDFIAQLCREYAECCRAAGRPDDGAACRAALTPLLPEGRFDAGNAQGCLEEERGKATSCDGSFLFSATCNKTLAVSGPKGAGETCELSADCAPPEAGAAWCLTSQDGSLRCRVGHPGTAGDAPCIGDKDGDITRFPITDGAHEGYICDRGDGLACSDSTGACEPLSPVGGACSDDNECAPSAFCDSSGDVCRARYARGEPCIVSDECEASDYCNDDDVCAPRFAQGEACAYSAQCLSEECTDQKCAFGNEAELDVLCGG